MITPTETETKIREALSDWINLFFDGGTHDVGGDMIDFPDVDLHLQRVQLKADMAKPKIVVERVPGPAPKSKATVAGMREVTERRFQILVVTAENNDYWDVNDNIQTLLGVIRNGAAAKLAEYGLKIRSLSTPTPIRMDASHEVQVSQRIMICTTTVAFKTWIEP